MKRRNLCVAGLLFVGVGCSVPANNLDGIAKWGVLLNVKGVSPTSANVPDAVKAEAANPTFSNPRPYTGPNSIDCYRTNSLQLVFDTGLYAEVSPPSHSSDVFQPYGRVNLKYAWGPSKGGEYSWGYTHSQNLHDEITAAWILYVYDLDRSAFPVSPEAGFRLNLGGTIFSLGAEYEHVKWSFYRGIESYGEPTLYLIGTSHINVLNAKVGFSILEDEMLSVGGLFPVMGEKGYGGFFNFQFGF
jgi:hypothetical protein